MNSGFKENSRILILKFKKYIQYNDDLVVLLLEKMLSIEYNEGNEEGKNQNLRLVSYVIIGGTDDGTITP